MGRVGIKLATLCCFSVLFIAIEAAVPAAAAAAPLRVGFYRRRCPSAETIVRKTVLKFAARNPGVAPGLIRMYFHDCFVRGCDASILLDSLPGAPSEKESPANNPSLRGFEVINEAKAKLEAICPGTVSCADILTFAARDASYVAGGIDYSVPSGRRDGRVSLVDEVLQNLPPPFFTVDQLEANFARKGLTLNEMVTLSGAHSFGISRCAAFANRLYFFNATHPQDPSLDPLYASFLKINCPNTADAGSRTVNMDFFTPNRLDNVYYTNLKHHRGLFTSDQTLYESPLTRRIVEENARRARTWKNKFAEAMVKMGAIEVLTGRQGEIRRQCNVVN